MSLTPVDPVLDVVLNLAEVDQDAANELVRLGLYEALSDQVSKNYARIQRDGAIVALQRINEAYEELDQMVGKADDGVLNRQYGYLRALEESFTEVAKGRLGDTVRAALGWDESSVRRDNRGRFAEEDGQPRNTSYADHRGRAVVDAMQGFTGRSGQSRILGALPLEHRTPAQGDDLAGRWNQLSNDTDRKTYRRMQLTGGALANVSTPGSGAHTIGGLAQLVGDLGPEAEKVLGPGIRRTAYRYRGTEKRPDAGLVRQEAGANRLLAPIMGHDQSQVPAALERVARLSARDRKDGDPVPVVLDRHTTGENLGLDPDQVALRTRGDVAAMYLSEKVPTAKLTEISRMAGELPPSLGVIINADGEIASESMGFQGDHYLPFDLRNLKSLQGGQYVRTRAVGGPTTEDIYTSLLTGTRQMQVVSNSGVFTVEFDPDLRGGRRYSDKARRMIGRYAMLLDAIDNGGIYANDIDPKAKHKLRQTAYEQEGFEPTAGREAYDRKLQSARNEASVGWDEEDLQARADLEAEKDPRWEEMSGQARGVLRQDKLREVKRNARDSAVRQYRLDGQGYYAALQSLQEEFPYYIRKVNYEPLPEFLEGRNKTPKPDQMQPAGRDLGYVEPGKTNAAAARLGRPKERGQYLSANTDQRQAPTASRESQEATGEGSGSTPAPGSPVAANANRPGATPIVGFRPKAGHPLSDQLEPNTPASVALIKAVGATAGIIGETPSMLFHLEQVEVDETQGEVTEAKAAELGGPALIKWKWDKLKDQPGNTSANFADWLVKASPETQSLVLDGIVRTSNSNKVMTELTPKPFESKQKVLADVSTIEKLIDLKAPFTPGDDILSAPNEKRPKPLTFPDIAALTDVTANYSGWLEQAGTNPKARTVVPFVTEFTGKDNLTIAKAIVDKQTRYKEMIAYGKKLEEVGRAGGDPGDIQLRTIADVTEADAPRAREMARDPKNNPEYKELSDMQLAWAFVRARDLTATTFTIGGGVEPPKAPDPASGPAAQGPGFNQAPEPQRPRGVNAFDPPEEEEENDPEGFMKALLPNLVLPPYSGSLREEVAKAYQDELARVPRRGRLVTTIR